MEMVVEGDDGMVEGVVIRNFSTSKGESAPNVRPAKGVGCEFPFASQATLCGGAESDKFRE